MKLVRSDIMRGTLAMVLVLAFQAAMSALFWKSIPSSNEQLLTYMLGQLSGMVTMALAYYFATTQSSQEKQHTIDRQSAALTGHNGDGKGE